MLRPPPLSPHLSLYRLPLTALLSITHRLTGVFLSLGVCVWLFLLITLRWNPATYEVLQNLLLTIPGRLFTGVFLFALFFHLSHGVRHLLWDAGHGLERDHLKHLAVVEILAALILTLTCMASALLT
ncbi:MAG: succinate dehydrogenase, cytochrome b556 subunit [Methylococcaceae bacterium]